MNRSQKVLIPVLLLILAMGFRFYRLGYKSFWVDEITTKTVSETGFRGSIEFASVAVNPPFHFLVAVCANSLGDSEAAFRLPAAVLGAVSVPLLFWAGIGSGRRVSVALVASVLLLLSPFHIRLSQDARMYSYVVFFTVLSTLTMMKVALPSKDTDGSRRLVGWGILFVVCSLLNVYTSYFAFFLLTAQLLFLMVKGGFGLLRKEAEVSVRTLRLFLVTAAVVVLAYVPWLPVLGRLTAKQVSGEPRALAESLNVVKGLFVDLGGGGTALAVIFFLLAVVGLWRLRTSSVALYVVFLFFIPLAGLTALGTRHFVASRYFSFLMPEFYLLVGGGVVTVGEVLAKSPILRKLPLHRSSRGSRAATAVLTVILLFGFARSLPRYYQGHVQNWREAVRILIRDGENNDLVFCGVNLSGRCLVYYLTHLDPKKRFRLAEGCRKRECFEEIFSQSRRGWLVTSHMSFLQQEYPGLWQVIQERMVLHTRVPALEEWGEIWILRLKEPEG